MTAIIDREPLRSTWRPAALFQTAICRALGSRLRAGGYGDSEGFRFFARSRRAAQYFRMRSDIARRFVGVSRCPLSARLGTGVFGFASRITLVGLDDVSGGVVVDGVVASILAAVHWRGVAAAISMPNISERSALASTLTPAGRLPFFERPDPAFAIKSR